MTVGRMWNFTEGGHRVPLRRMIADDLGLDLLDDGLDPILLAAGIRAPRLTKSQRMQDQMSVARSANPMTDEKRERMRELGRFSRSVAGKAAREEVRDILQRYRKLGEVRR